MTITVFGATGLTGKYILKLALWQEHTVRAFGRNVHELVEDSERHGNLQLYKGGVFDAKDVLKAIKGADAVISAIGGQGDETDRTRSLGMKTIIGAMKEAGVRRIIGIGGQGILNSEQEGAQYIFEEEDFPKQYLAVSHEHFKAYEYLQDSELDWTFVCPPQIVDAPVTANYSVKKDYPASSAPRINAGDLAEFILKEINKNEFVGARVGISN